MHIQQQHLPRRYRVLVRTYANPTRLVGGIHRTEWLFIVVWSITTFLENLSMLFLFLEGAWYDTLDFSFVGFSSVFPYRNFKFRRICCTSNYMGIPVTLAQSILGVPWPTFRQIHRLFFPLEDLLRLIWSFLGTIAWRVLGVLFCAFFSVLRALPTLSFSG